MSMEIRKIVKIVEETRLEMGRAPERPVEMVAFAAVLTNPWACEGYGEDLTPKVL